jgi:hypothetical protein
LDGHLLARPVGGDPTHVREDIEAEDVRVEALRSRWILRGDVGDDASDFHGFLPRSREELQASRWQQSLVAMRELAALDPKHLDERGQDRAARCSVDEHLGCSLAQKSRGGRCFQELTISRARIHNGRA